jgi:predicted Fe-S protein YdhL (DUF1289 family)
MGSVLYRRSRTSLPTSFVSTQRLTEIPLPCVTVCHHISTGLYRSLSAQRLSEIPLPCVTVCHLISTGLYRSLSAQRLSEIPLPCVTVCHHISTGLYRSLSAQRHSESTVLKIYFYKYLINIVIWLRKLHKQSAFKPFKTETDVHCVQTSRWFFTENTLCYR